LPFITMIQIVLDTNILHQEGLGSKKMRLLTRLALADELAISVRIWSLASSSLGA
jgi:hypothetical protein